MMRAGLHGIDIYQCHGKWCRGFKDLILPSIADLTFAEFFNGLNDLGLPGQ